MIKKIQRKATRLCNGIRYLQYDEKLSLLNLPFLYYRRFRGNMITTFNLIHHYLNLYLSLFSNTATYIPEDINLNCIKQDVPPEKYTVICLVTEL